MTLKKVFEGRPEMDQLIRTEILKNVSILNSQLTSLKLDNYRLSASVVKNIVCILNSIHENLIDLNAVPELLCLSHLSMAGIKSCNDLTMMPDNICLQLNQFNNQIIEYIQEQKKCSLEHLEIYSGQQVPVAEIQTAIDLAQKELKQKEIRSPKTLLISSQGPNGPLGSILLKEEHEYHHLEYLLDIYNLGKKIRHYELIIIDGDDSPLSVFLCLRVINLIHRKCFILVCGDKKHIESADEFADLAYFWLGKKSPAFMNLLILILYKYRLK